MVDGNKWDFLRRYPEKQERLLVGLMSGTSVDGVDAALVRISGSGRSTEVDVLAFEVMSFPAKLRETVLSVSHGQGNAETVSHLNVDLANLFADSVEAVLKAAGVAASSVDAIASHGQTVSHTSHKLATLQIGEPSVIAHRLGIPVVSDFRTADRAVGGHGAPLVPYADWCLLTDATKSRAIQNIGGIGNVTYLPANARPEQVLGFDTGPGNMLIDRSAAWASDGTLSYDRDGDLAASGKIDYDILEQLLKHDYLKRHPPKSAGREEFGEKMFYQILSHLPPPAALPITRGIPARLQVQTSPVDIVATFTAFTALSIADAYERHLPAMPDEVIVGGGGARNLTLMRMLAEKLAPIPVRMHEDVGMNSDSKEAVAFTLLANETLLGKPSNLPSVTGASRPVILGKLTLP